MGLSGENAGKFEDRGGISAADFGGATYTKDVATSMDDDGSIFLYSLVFGDNGTASIGYTYSGMDMENKPPYIGSGTFSVSGATVTVVINGCTITMECTDLWTLDELRIKSISSEQSISELGNLRAGFDFICG